MASLPRGALLSLLCSPALAAIDEHLITSLPGWDGELPPARRKEGRLETAVCRPGVQSKGRKQRTEPVKGTGVRLGGRS